jgi:Spy/CpxP family protein refolding chaperone
MNTYSENRIVFWILIFLVLINITALATYFIYIRKPVNVNMQAGYRQGIALRQELSLTSDQSLEVNRINSVYRASSEPVVERIRQKKAELLEELSKVVPDTTQLQIIANEIVTEQRNLQEANIRQFLDLKKVCTPEQTEKLSQIYAELYGCENTMKSPGKGKGMRQRHRFGQKQAETK